MKNFLQAKSYVYVALAVILWASTAAVAKLVLENLDNFQVLLYASLIATASLFVIVILQGKLPLIKTYTLKDYSNFAYMGFIGVFLYYVFLYAGLMLSSAQEAFIVNYTWPIWVVIFSVLILKEKFGYRKLFAIILSFIGVYFVVTKGSLSNFSVENLQGDFFALLGAVCYGIFSVLGKKHNYEKFTSMLFYYAFATVFIFVTTLLFSSIPIVSLGELVGLIWLGIFTSGLAFVFWFLALKHGDTAEMSNIVFLTPFLSLVYIYFLLGEKILFSSILGLVLIVAGILIQSFKRKEFAAKEKLKIVNVRGFAAIVARLSNPSRAKRGEEIQFEQF